MSVTLNGHTYDATNFVGADARGYSQIFPATGLTLFPNSIFTDMLAELAGAATVQSISPGAAGGILVSTGAAWKRAASATITDAGAATFASISGPLNGTIGATTPAAGAFTTLSASGDATMAANYGTVYTAPNGTTKRRLTIDNDGYLVTEVV